MIQLPTLKDCDVFDNPEFKDPKLYTHRKTVKVIVMNDKGEIALVTNPIHKMFTLPGGGAESEHLEKEAEREILEETGCFIKDIHNVAFLEEFRNRNAIHSTTTCFAASAAKKSTEDRRTEEEKENGLETVWVEVDKALSILNEQQQVSRTEDFGFYNTAFNIVRDYRFVAEWSKNISI